MSKQAHQSQKQPPQNQWTIKTNKKKYKQGKVIAKGVLYVRQTQRVRMKDNQENKELNEKSRHTKEYLRKSTRVD